MATVANPLQQAADILQETKETVIPLLKGHDHISISFNHRLGLMINQLNFLLGNSSVDQTDHKRFGPVTHFMGEEIKVKKPIIKSDLSPKDSEKQIFIGKVKKLQDNFDNMTNEEILEAYKIEPNVVRGVAKFAGLDEYKTAEFNLSFIADIRVGLAAQKELVSNQLVQENKISKAVKVSSTPQDNIDPEEEDE